MKAQVNFDELGGGGALNIEQDSGSTTQSTWHDTGISADKAVLVGVSSSAHQYTDVFQIESGTATVLVGDLYNGTPLFSIRLSNGTVEIQQNYGGGTYGFDYFVAYTE